MTWIRFSRILRNGEQFRGGAAPQGPAVLPPLRRKRAETEYVAYVSGTKSCVAKHFRRPHPTSAVDEMLMRAGNGTYQIGPARLKLNFVEVYLPSDVCWPSGVATARSRRDGRTAEGLGEFVIALRRMRKQGKSRWLELHPNDSKPRTLSRTLDSSNWCKRPASMGVINVTLNIHLRRFSSSRVTSLAISVARKICPNIASRLLRLRTSGCTDAISP